MRIGILTYHFANNYGAVLQVYALQRLLAAYGGDVEVINYVSKQQQSNNGIFENWTSVKGIIKNVIRLPHYNKRCKRIAKFQDFRERYLCLSSEDYSTQEELFSFLKEEYDRIVVGSDQVWNPNTLDFNPIYFRASQLSIPVVAYAASMGNAKKENIIPYIQDVKAFQGISVREASGVELLKNIDSTIDCINVMDPTLLISSDEYNQLSEGGMRIEKPYIACYYLGRNNYMKVIKVMNKVSRLLNLPVYYINASNGLASYHSHMINDAGPEDFVSLIKHATVVFTNSFHATAISIKLGVPFFNFEESGSNDNRKKDLLERFGIKDRAIYDYDFEGTVEINNSDVLHAQTQIDLLASDSREYLKKIVN